MIKDPSFVSTRDFVLIKSKKEDMRFSTEYALLDLEYDIDDVLARLSELTLEEYSETLLDKDDVDPPALYVFGKLINGKLVYIKLKMRESEQRKVICVSFHYARKNMSFPFSKGNDERRE